jgi:hypothetical protein
MRQLKVRLNDELGKVVYQRTISSVKAGEEIAIPVKSLGKGVYVLSLTTDKGTTNEKVMVQ